MKSSLLSWKYDDFKIKFIKRYPESASLEEKEQDKLNRMIDQLTFTFSVLQANYLEESKLLEFKLLLESILKGGLSIQDLKNIPFSGPLFSLLNLKKLKKEEVRVFFVRMHLSEPPEEDNLDKMVTFFRKKVRKKIMTICF